MGNAHPEYSDNIPLFDHDLIQPDEEDVLPCMCKRLSSNPCPLHNKFSFGRTTYKSLEYIADVVCSLKPTKEEQQECKIEFFKLCIQAGFVQSGHVFADASRSTLRSPLDDDRFKLNGPKIEVMFDKFSSICKFLIEEVDTTNEYYDVTIQLIEFVIEQAARTKRICDVLTSIDQISWHELQRFAKDLDDLHIYMAHFAKHLETYPRYLQYSRASVFIIFLKGSIGRSSTTSREILNKVVRRLLQHTPMFSSANIPKYRKFKQFGSDAVIENNGTLNTLFIVFEKLLIYLSSDMLENIIGNVMICTTEQVPLFLQKPLMALTPAKYYKIRPKGTKRIEGDKEKFYTSFKKSYERASNLADSLRGFEFISAGRS